MDVQIRAFMKHCSNILISILVITICFLCNQAFRMKRWIGKANDFLLMLLEKRERKEEDYDSEAVERGNKFVDHLLRIIFQNREASESYRVEDKVVTIDQKITFINIHGKFGLCSTNLQFDDVFQRSGKCSLREEDDKIRVNAVIGGSLFFKTNACIEFLLLTRMFPMNGILPYIETYIEFEFDKSTHKNGKILELFIDEIRGMHLKFEDGGVLKRILNIILNNSINVFQSLLKNVFQSELKAELNMLIKNLEFPAEMVAERQLHSIQSKEQIMSSTQDDSVSKEQYMEQCAPEEYQTIEKNDDSQDFSMQAQQSQASEPIKDSPLVKHFETSQALDRILNVDGSEILQDSEGSMLIKHVKESQTSECILAPLTTESVSVTECEASQGPESFSLSKQQETFHSLERSPVKKRVRFQSLSDSSEYEEGEACEGCPLISSPLECEQSQTLDDSAFVEESEDNEKLSVPETPCTLQPFSDKKEFFPLAESPLTEKNDDANMDLVLKDSSPKNESVKFDIINHNLREKKMLDILDTSEKQCDADYTFQTSPGESHSLTEFSAELKEPRTSFSSKDSYEEPNLVRRTSEDAKSMKHHTFETALDEQDDRCISQAVFEQVHTGIACEAELRSEKRLTPRIFPDEQELLTSDSLSCKEQKIIKTEALIQEEFPAGGQTMDIHTIEDIPVEVQSEDLHAKYEQSEELVESASSEEQTEDPSSSEDSSSEVPSNLKSSETSYEE